MNDGSDPLLHVMLPGGGKYYMSLFLFKEITFSLKMIEVSTLSVFASFNAYVVLIMSKVI